MVKKDITILLQRVNSGEKELLNDVYSRLYDDIKQVAKYQINKLQTGQTMTPTVLAHECYLKLIKQNDVKLKDSKHFLNCLSISMRQLLVDVHRAKISNKRQHDKIVDNLSQVIGEKNIDFKILELDQLLEKVNIIDPQSAMVLNYKIILAMTFKEIAVAMDLSVRQVKRVWSHGKSLLMMLSKAAEGK